MRLLIADDDVVSRRLLEATLVKWGHEVVVTADGAQAWGVLQGDDAPRLAILDWMMPELDGLEVCRKVRQRPTFPSPYLILLTAKGQREDIVTGLEAGADDYITKPFDRAELRARIQVGARVLALQQSLADRVLALEDALTRVKQLQGLVPICAYCKKVRNDRNYWQQVESYVAEYSGAQFTHSICPACYETVVRHEVDLMRRQKELGPS